MQPLFSVAHDHLIVLGDRLGAGPAVNDVGDYAPLAERAPEFVYCRLQGHPAGDSRHEHSREVMEIIQKTRPRRMERRHFLPNFHGLGRLMSRKLQRPETDPRVLPFFPYESPFARSRPASALRLPPMKDRPDNFQREAGERQEPADYASVTPSFSASW